MKLKVNNEQKMTEIIFANRNKAYGAYEIRSSYGETVFKSLTFVSVTFLIVFAFGYYYTHKTEITNTVVLDQIVPKDIVTVVDIKPEVEIEKPKAKNIINSSPEKLPNTQSLGTIIKDSVAVETTSVALNSESISASTLTGNSTGSVTGNTSSSDGTSTTNLVNNDAVIFADSQPEFEGGLSALYKFISSKIVYPNNAREAGKEGTAYIRFIVDEQGNVTNVITQNKLGYGLDEEAKRVIELLPKFKKPGYINKQPVKVYYNIPIKFTMGK
jgi:protein TonB